MSGFPRRVIAAGAFAAMLLATGSMLGGEVTRRVTWSAIDVRGNPVRVPAGDRPSVLLFFRAAQPQSEHAAEQLRAALVPDPATKAARPAPLVVLILSGQAAREDARQVSAKWPWPAVTDADYAACGQMSVRVWPTTLVVAKDGTLLAHVAGIPSTYARDLEGHLAFAAGGIDRAALEKRLNSHDPVVDSGAQVAHRHLEVAHRLLDKGLTDQAKAEVDQAIRRQPDDPAVVLAIAETLLLGGRAERAMQLIDAMSAEQRAKVPAWQLELLRGRALVALGKWSDAESALREATHLSPAPGDGYYFLGIVYQQRGDWDRAAEMFRQAFESTPAGRRLRPAAASRPATRRSSPESGSQE